MEYTTLKAKHLSIFWYQITATNTSHSTRENMQDTWRTSMTKRIHILTKIQMPTAQTVLQWKEWCQNKWNLTPEPSCHKLKPNIMAKLEVLLKEYESQFAQDETSISTTPLTKLSIDTENSHPIPQKPYPTAMKHYQWVKDEIEKWLTAKVIQGSRSSWSAPIIVIPKRDGGKYLVTDYQALNKVTRKFIWPMPKVEDIFSQLNGARYLSTLGLWAGYHHIPLHEGSIPKTAFTLPFGKYEYIKVPFGLTQAPAYFQEPMTGILKDFKFAIGYLDDISIFSKTAEEHKDHIKQFSRN